MALFSECMQRCAKKEIDRAGVVREAIYHQLMTYCMVSDHSKSIRLVLAFLGVLTKFPTRLIGVLTADGDIRRK